MFNGERIDKLEEDIEALKRRMKVAESKLPPEPQRYLVVEFRNGTEKKWLKDVEYAEARFDSGFLIVNHYERGCNNVGEPFPAKDVKRVFYREE